MRILRPLVAALFTLAAFVLPAKAQGTLSIALSQQFSFSGCQTSGIACGQPLAGGLLYFYQVGTVATRQDSFADSGLTIPNAWPLALDANGRVPSFYLASGSVHVRLTDANGLVQFDVPAALVVGAAGGGGGGGQSIDTTGVLGTGDVKWRPFSGTITGWVRSNGLTVGNAVSGATERANADTQNLFVLLWTSCGHCTVLGGKGGTALADFNANKQITLPDMRGRGQFGLDDMGNVAAGAFTGVPFSGGDTATTPGGLAGENTHTLLLAEAPTGQFTFNFNDPGHSHAFPGGAAVPTTTPGGGIAATNSGAVNISGTASATTGITASITDHAGGGAHNNVSEVTLGTWYVKL